jgi:16S rRNA (adenine1518-N6/adenine1519-N6)-dimethyltransferase
MVLMFQREVVDRMTAEPGDSERGYLTVITEAFLEIERLFDVPPTAFKPVPKIWSSVVRLTPRDTRFFDGRETEFETLVSAAFLQKRKTLQNNLRRAAAELGIKNISELLEAAKIEPSRRAETLSIDEWVRLLAALNG